MDATGQSIQTDGAREWRLAHVRVVAQLGPDRCATLTDEAIENLVDMDPAGLARGRTLLDVLVEHQLDTMQDLGIVARRS